MMSELNARILSTISKETATNQATASDADKSRASSRKKRIPPYAQFPANVPLPQSDGGSSGYMADTDAHTNAATVPPGSIDLESSRQSSKRFAIPEIKPLVKRHKPLPEEVRYNAARAFEDLAAGNIEAPVVQPNRPRIFPTRSGVNMSSVSLMSAKSLKDTPIFSMSPEICVKPPPDFIYDFSVITSLASEVASSYKEKGKNALSNELLHVIQETSASSQGRLIQDAGSISGSESVAESATSSFTESGSDGGENEGKPSELSKAVVSESEEAQVSDITSIGQVMELSSSPRLLVSSCSPFKVLQVNAAFHRFSESFSFLGKSAGDLTKDATLLETLCKAGASRRPFKIQISKFCWENSKPTDISVYPVGSDKGSAITHFAIEVLDHEHTQSPTNHDAQTAVPGHVVVTG